MLSFANVCAQGNHVFTTGEAANYSSINLATSGGQTWSTDRASLPGYFSTIAGATYSGASDAANINGYVKKYGNEVYTFPVGTGTDLRTLTINNTSGLDTDAFAVAWIAGNPSGNLDPTAPNAGAHPLNAVGSDIVTVSPVGQWDWQVGNAGNLGAGTTGTGAGIPITVSIPDLSLFATAAALRLVGWNGSQWINLSGTTGASGNVENSILGGTMIEGITAVAIGSTEYVLSDKLLNFSVKEAKNCRTVATWSVSEETSISRYELEHSTNGVSYSKVLSADSKNGAGITSYSFSFSQTPGNNYYRLKIIDNNGLSDYTDIISLRSNCTVPEDYIILYPNIVTESNTEITLEYRQQSIGKGWVVVTNSMGQQLLTQSITLTDGIKNCKINTGSFQQGMHYVYMTDGSGDIVGTPQKFLKQ